ncbi:pyridoxine/pyridoxamine 5'-phosphate oxidase-like isoform X1 [Ptychodera flava]|uniref:pyridoxine/pyridoxamine 5'-phosphate oxidase-like isoform X1 n=2 Tax=Ptychodera flava TaxID=63121 RepID=UPI00396A6608
MVNLQRENTSRSYDSAGQDRGRHQNDNGAGSRSRASDFKPSYTTSAPNGDIGNAKNTPGTGDYLQQLLAAAAATNQQQAQTTATTPLQTLLNLMNSNTQNNQSTPNNLRADLEPRVYMQTRNKVRTVRFTRLTKATKLDPVLVVRHFCDSSDDDMADINVAAMRKAYKAGHQAFFEKDLEAKEPIAQFAAWFKLACEDPKIGEANAMTLATATKDGKPSARMVLLKGFSTDGFIFYTNYGSRKAEELISNPFASLVFYWESLSRSVRIEGSVEKLSEKASTDYFHSRPKASQIGACVSHQSTVIESRDVLLQREAELQEKYANPDSVIPKPEFWGGFILKPQLMEFWQGQSNRIHDRIVFRKPKDGEVIDDKLTHKAEDGWVYERLSP